MDATSLIFSTHHHMKDFLALPVVFTTLAQLPIAPNAATWERLGIAGLSLFVTVFIWRYFTAREAKAMAEALEEKRKHEEADAIERNRLLQIQNELQAQVVNLLKQARTDSDAVARQLLEHPVHAIIENPTSNPVNTKPI